MIGKRLAHYHVVDKLGEGGMGEVFRATDTKLGRAVALKVLPSDMARDPDRLARFQREARAIAALNHPHIVTIYSVDDSDGVHFLTMELIEGQPLTEVIAEGGMAVDRTIAIGSALADALSAAHDKGIVHRDLKPANVMITNDGRVKVLDFGLAKELRSINPADATLTSAGRTEIGVVMGTPAYMSPEQVAGRSMDHRTDIFSLGVLLYQMASGQRPFEGLTSIELASAILRDTPRPLGELRHDVPADLARLIRRCLEKDPARRVQTARDVGNELRDIARSIVAEAPTKADRTPERVERVEGTRPERAERVEGFGVAVLPFKYAGANPDVAALAEGLSEEIVTGLSRFSYLRVLARGASSTNARYVMEGSIRQAGSAIRVAVQLVDAVTAAHLWAETYDRQFQAEQLFAIQDELIPRIVSTCADSFGVLARNISDAVREKPSDQLTPYEALMRGFGYYLRLTPDEHAAARDALERAVQQAPRNADCLAMLSWVYAHEYGHGFNVRPGSLDRALAVARRAVDAAPSNSLAHQALAVALFFRKEVAACLNAAERSIALNPLDGCNESIFIIAFTGDWDRGCVLIRRAMQLNPHHPGWFHVVLALNEYRTGHYRAAVDDTVKANVPGIFWTHIVLAAAHGQLGEVDAARAALRDLLAQKPDFAGSAAESIATWFDPELTGHLIDGLRKAGLDIASPASSPARARVDSRRRGSGPSRTIGADDAPASIAVLPFANLSADKDQEYFSDGLAEEIINLLAQVPGLKVIARTSAFAFRGKEQDIREIAGALGVTTVLQGSVRRAGSRIRVATQLIHAADGAHLWSERFDRELTEVFAVQDEIAAAIVSALKVTLTGGQSTPRSYEPNVPAYEAFLYGRHQYYQFSPEHFATAEQHFLRAMELDPGWAEPHASLGDLYFALAFYGWRPFDDMIVRARAAARRALDLVPSHPLGHAVVGIIAAHHDYDWAEAEVRFRHVHASEFVPPNVHLLSLFYLLSLGRFDAALAEVDQAIAQDPLNSFWRARRVWALQNANRHDDAIAEGRKALTLDPANYQARMMMALGYVCQGNLALALEASEAVYRTASFDAFNTGLLGAILSRLGEKDRAQQVLATMTGAVTIGMTIYHLMAGEIDAALDWYQQDIALQRPNAPLVAFASWLAPMRASPRWPQIAGSMNLPAAGT